MYKKIIPIAIALFAITACGPSHEDEIAADNACDLVKKYEEMQAAEGTDREYVTQYVFIGSMEDYVSIQVPRSNSDNVKELMKKSCPDKISVFEEIMEGE